MVSVEDYLSSNLNGYIWNERLEQRLQDEKSLERYGYKVYSQNDEDGIIEEIFNRIGTSNQKYIEFGVQDGIESNGHYLLLKGWSGLWIECDESSFQQIQSKFKFEIEKQKLRVDCQFITRENINSIFEKNGFTGEIDLLSIDIDGNDYHVWEAINVVNPRVVVIEYNAKIPPSCHWIMPYCEEHLWDGGDKHSASLLALKELGNKKGYSLVGTNLSGVNAFFVRNDCVNDMFYCNDMEKAYNPPRYYKKFYSGHPSFYCLADLPEGREQLFCGITNNIVMGMGFCTKETSGFWMNSKTAFIWINNIDASIDNLRLCIKNPKQLIGSMCENFILKLQIEDTVLYDGQFEDEKCFEIAINEKKIIKIIVSTNRLWVPMEYQLGNDMRKLGLLVSSIECKKGK